MRCSKCGHDNPPGAGFCLNCGNSLHAAGPANSGGLGASPGGAPVSTAGQGPGLPATCPSCRTDNPPGMRFCRNCGTVLQTSSPGILPTPYLGGAPAAMAPPPMAPPPMAPPPMAPPLMAPPPMASHATGACPRCGAGIQPGFAFCQQCGFRVAAPAVSGELGAGPGRGPVDPQLATLAAGNAEALLGGGLPARTPPAPARGAPGVAGEPWGQAVSVNRDGTDGERYPLAGEYVVFGRDGADISIDQDRFLARAHARLEPGPDGAKVTPIDTLNGVFRKIDKPHELASGAIVLIGREVLRFDRLDPEERNPAPLVRHGVALFGSPPREPWGRLSQLLPSGGVRDVRHLMDDEVVVGREEGDLVFSDDAFLSRRHCTLTWDGTRVVITDLNSSNGTFVRLARPATVRHGEHLRVGDQLFRIELRR
ncbi:MAG: zinc ribbon domain-containing protein [Kofleriaceae bacterium]